MPLCSSLAVSCSDLLTGWVSGVVSVVLGVGGARCVPSTWEMPTLVSCGLKSAACPEMAHDRKPNPLRPPNRSGVHQVETQAGGPASSLQILRIKPHKPRSMSDGWNPKTCEHGDGAGSEVGPFTCFYEATKSLSYWGWYSWTTQAPSGKTLSAPFTAV